MHNRTIARSGLLLLPLLMFADAAEAKIRTFTFNGTRDQVRAACKGEGKELIEGKDHTICLAPTAGVVCYDDGKCHGSGPRKLRDCDLPAGEHQVPQSLIESSGGSPAAPSPEPAPAPANPPVIN